MLEPECINLYLENGKERSFQDRIYRGDKISPAITTSFRPYYLVGGGYSMTDKINMLGMLDIKGDEQIRRVYGVNGCAPTLNTMQGGNREPKIMIKQATQKGYIEAQLPTVADLNYPDSTTRRGRICDGGKVSPTVITNENNLSVIETNYRIRKLTPRECWRLMGFTDEDFNKASQVNSNSQLYKQAGNSIVVNCLEEIFKELL